MVAGAPRLPYDSYFAGGLVSNCLRVPSATDLRKPTRKSRHWDSQGLFSAEHPQKAELIDSTQTSDEI